MPQFINAAELPLARLAGRKILFANFPADGHFNPLTGVAVYLKSLGCDVRWYTSTVYGTKLGNLGIPHFTFNHAKDVNGENLETVFPERDAIKGQIAKLNFDMINAFILRSSEYYMDLKQIHESFPFEMVVADCLFTGIPFIADKMNIPVIALGVLPLTETSKDLPPAGIGMTPSYTFFGKIKQWLLREAAERILFRKPNKVMRELFQQYGMNHEKKNAFDLIAKKSTLILQSGTPGFEYYRSDLGKNVRFIGSLLPYRKPGTTMPWYDARLSSYNKVILVTQGTIERDPEKLLVPTLEAFADTDTLVIATTGGNGTAALRSRFPQPNIIIEDFIPFAEVMPYADVYVTNGGYGGVMLGIENKLPLVVAGIHEGKNEINARIGYFRLGINLRTETPKAAQVRKAVQEVLANDAYRKNIELLADEFSRYDTNNLCAQYIAAALPEKEQRYASEEASRVY